MPAVVRVGDLMSGSVAHHNGHITHYRDEVYYVTETRYDEDGESYTVQVPYTRSVPVYCSGHSVSGNQISGSSKFKINGIPIGLIGVGSSNCPCHTGSPPGYTNHSNSSKFKINGIRVVKSGDSVDIHSAGTGYMQASISKFKIT